MNLQGRNLTEGMQGDDVALLHTELTQLVQAGQLDAEIDPGEVTRRAFGPTTRDAVVRFQQQHGLRPAGIVEAETARLINEAVDALVVDVERYVVRGQVHRNGRPFAGGLVRAFDRDMRSEELLGEATTEGDGRYEITYSADRFARAEKERADLLVRVFDADGREVATSGILFNAAPVETVDLDIVTDGRVPSEYECYLAELIPLVQSVPLAELTDEDRTFLHGETGIDAQHLLFLTVAAQQGLRTDLPPEMFYGFCRQGLPVGLAALVVTREETLRSALEASVQGNLIPAQLEDSIDNFLRRLSELEIEQPTFLMQPAVLFAAPSDGADLSPEHAGLIVDRLNEQLRGEVLKTLSSVSEAMRQAVQAAAARLDYRSYREADLATVIRQGLLPELRSGRRLADEVADLERQLSERATQPVHNALHLDTPVKEHPAFQADLRRARAFEYARLAKLDQRTARTLAATEVPLHDVDDVTLDAWVEEGILDEQQRTDLRQTVEFGKLTDDNLAFVEALQDRSPSSPRTLAAWDTDDWTALITEHDLPSPRGETAEQYAATIRFNLEHTYPSQALLTRLLSPRQTPRIQHLDALQPLLETNERLIEGTRPAVIDWDPVDADRRGALQQQLQDLAGFANTYHHLGLAAVINDKSLSLNEKKEILNTRLRQLDTFYENNEDVDLRLVDFFDREDDALRWDGIQDEDRPAVRKQVMAYQRMLNLADDTATRETLLGNGYDAAMTIAVQTEEEFIRTSGLKRGTARMVYARAQETAVSVTHYTEVAREMVGGGFNDLNVSNQTASWVNDLMELDGFADLFGPQDFCACEHCRSILSPAAYFVDLMHFVEQHVSQPTFKNLIDGTRHPLHLMKRRGDLWTLPLTCENTHTLIPYLTIVNEELEHYLETITGGDIYEKLNNPNEKISFELPFNLPLEETRLYLRHFGITLYDVYRLLNEPEEKVWRARLNLSKQELDVVTTPDPTDVVLRYGNPSTLANFDVQDFIRVAGITRQQLDELLGLRYRPDLHSIEVARESEPEELQNFREILKNLTADRLDFVHRFVRLWRKTAWTIPELDLLLMALHDAGSIGADLAADAVRTLAQLTNLQETLRFSVEELSVMVHQLPVSHAFPFPPAKQSERRLYERLFDLEKLFGEKDPTTHELNTTTTFHHFSLNTLDPNDQEIDPKTPVLLGGVGVSETELLLLFDLLKDEMPFDAEGDTILDRAKLSLLYRHARLARALGLKIDDFTAALRLNFGSADEVVTTLGQVQTLWTFWQWLRSSSFTVSELRFILQGDESATVKYRMTLETVSALVQDVQASQEPDQVKALRAQLSQAFNLSTQQLEDALKWAATVINGAGIQTALETSFTDSKPDQPGDLAPLLDLVHELERALLLFANLKLKEETLAYITATPEAFGIADLTGLTLADVKALEFFKQLIEPGTEVEAIVQTIFDDYLSDGTFSSDAIRRVAELRKQDKSLIKSLINAFTLSAVPVQAVAYLSEAIALCRTLGVNGYSLLKLGKDADFEDVAAARDVALGAFSSKYDDEQTRREKLEPYQDQVNILKRDALCGFIIAQQTDLKFKDRSDLYGYFLLDVEMSGCFRISRVVAAISSLQLYVHRCLVNLEQSDPDMNPSIPDVQVDPAMIPADQWEWRKNYRVWEANRKVFLYPENYLEPDLRDNKTPICKELEEELLQEKITMEAAEAAYKKYIAQFSELARLRIAGSYYHKDSNTYYFFGRTAQDPFQYYYRTWERQKIWTPWVKIELAVNARHVAAEILRGRLFLFWVEPRVQERNEIEGGSSTFKGFQLHINLVYSGMNESGRWLSPQRMELLPPAQSEDKIDSLTKLKDFEGAMTYDAIYPIVADNQLLLVYWNRGRHTLADQVRETRILNVNNNELSLGDYHDVPLIQPGEVIRYSHFTGNYTLMVVQDYSMTLPWYDSEIKRSLFWNDSGVLITKTFRPVGPLEIYAIHNRFPESTITLNGQYYLLKNGGWWVVRHMVRLSTSLSDDLGHILLTQGLETFLSLETQELKEKALGITITNKIQLAPPYNDPNHIDLKSTYGTYYRELFFHIPFLIARHLNANEKFAEAKWWYERIFDPSASEAPDPEWPRDRNWRYIEFRKMTLQKMKDILTDEAAIKQYEQDPFNPHAIARLRLSAYQKAIVMKYIDNLLDWGDYLFTLDTMESINEATMLYVLASDILGKRPARLGTCETAEDKDLTYQQLGPAIDKGSEFLIALENWTGTNFVLGIAHQYVITGALNAEGAAVDTFGSDGSGGDGIHAGTSIKGADLSRRTNQYRVVSYRTAVQARGDYGAAVIRAETGKSAQRAPALDLTKQSSTLAFCVPPNADLLKYWDRVEDRLFKIRNCMNISGVRRQLALFQPPIDPMLLVRARAAGLSLEDVLAALAAPLPPYRFSYLIEKAKQMTQTVQSFGSALLGALEKKDVEELTLLRSVHERNLLRMTRDVKRNQVQEAQRQLQSIKATEANVQNRINYHTALIEAGLTTWEITQQVSRHTATGLKTAESIVHLLAAITYLVGEVGSPFAMKYGGKQLGDSGVEFAAWTSAMAAIAEAISASAGLEATFQRREQEWKHQLTLATQEAVQVEQQRLAAELREAMAHRDLEIHEQSMEQADELEAFYKSKFSALGLYNYYATTLNRLYREAYNVALDLARMAERTYQFERDDDTVFIAGDNWQYDRAGLLAGERLLLQLQRMEHAYLQNHRRDYEVTQSFSLALTDPWALTQLKQTGSCEFKLDERLFDLAYPGQFRRLIKTVRVTIPCVTGPHTNVSAKLTLLNSWLREADNLTTTLLEADHTLPIAKGTSISTSSGQSDAGLFELNFRDERYLPFEGAGAISEWKLELPAKLRLFDYDTISDVLFHISYTAKDDGNFKTTVEEHIASELASTDLHRLISLRHEFPGALHRLLNSSGIEQATDFEVTKQHFPYFLVDRDLTMSDLRVYLKPKSADPVDTSGLNLQVNGTSIAGGWSVVPSTNLKEGSAPVLGNPIRMWTIHAGTDGLNREELEDILILVKYTASS